MLHHVGLEVKSLERSIRFYHEAFGLEEESRHELSGEKIVFLRRGDFRLELVEQPEEDQASSRIHLAFRADDVHQQVERLMKLGAVSAQPPQRLENGWTHAFVIGPDGEMIEVIRTD